MRKKRRTHPGVIIISVIGLILSFLCLMGLWKVAELLVKIF